MKLHYKLNHLPYKQMQVLADRGILPAKFGSKKNTPPPCAGCVFGKQKRTPWRRSKKQSKPLKKATKLGKRVHVDCMVSRQPGLIPQVLGFLTNRRYAGALVFVEELSDFTYVHLVQGFTDADTLQGKHAFENLMQSYGVTVQAYHGDNGNFSNQAFMSDCYDKQQQITFCGVVAHHQSGIVERRIGDLTPAERTLLVHGQRMYPSAVKTMLWSFAFVAAVRNRNCYRLDAEGLSPIERLSQVKLQSGEWT